MPSQASAVPWFLRHAGVLGLWKAARSWTAATVVAGFPLVFVLDGAVAWPLSPVLPGLLGLLAVLVLLPLGLFELWLPRHRRLAQDARDRRAHRLASSGRFALGIAWSVFAVWLLWGI